MSPSPFVVELSLSPLEILPELVAATLLPEQFEGPDGSSLELIFEANQTLVTISANSLGSLRAALQGVMRMIDVASKI